MFEITLNAVLLIVMFQSLHKNSTHMIDRIIEFFISFGPLDGEKFADQKDSIELSFYFIDGRGTLFFPWIVTPHWLAKSETF